MTLIITMIMAVQLLPPAPIASISRSTTHWAIVGALHRPRPRKPIERPPQQQRAWIDIPASMVGPIDWVATDLAGKQVASGTAPLSEAGGRQISFSREQMPVSGVYAILCIDQRGQYMYSTVVVSPN